MLPPIEQGGFWHEAQPIVRHAGVVVLLELGVIAIGAGALLLQKLFPNQEYYLSWVEFLDVWLFLALLSMFGVYTLCIVALRLGRGIKEEVVRMRRSL